jgi:hypothetical protein
MLGSSLRSGLLVRLVVGAEAASRVCWECGLDKGPCRMERCISPLPRGRRLKILSFNEVGFSSWPLATLCCDLRGKRISSLSLEGVIDGRRLGWSLGISEVLVGKMIGVSLSAVEGTRLGTSLGIREALSTSLLGSWENIIDGSKLGWSLGIWEEAVGNKVANLLLAAEGTELGASLLGIRLGDSLGNKVEGLGASLGIRVSVSMALGWMVYPGPLMDGDSLGPRVMMVGIFEGSELFVYVGALLSTKTSVGCQVGNVLGTNVTGGFDGLRVGFTVGATVGACDIVGGKDGMTVELGSVVGRMVGGLVDGETVGRTGGVVRRNISSIVFALTSFLANQITRYARRQATNESTNTKSIK